MSSLKDKLLKEMIQYFEDDEKRISHAVEVTRYAEEILKGENGDEDIVISASIFHDIGIPESERKYGSNAGHYQEIEGPPIARKILEKYDLSKEFIDEVCEIIGNHHSPDNLNTINFKIVYDADCLVNFGDQIRKKDETFISTLVDKVFLTATGGNIAKKINKGN
ncbi:MAG: HD domain-containing protein [Candidatus Poribacteria bacterium]